ncbi:hypothetical protein C8Q77DRAFT_1048447 [Trametes polyzona]|nr:hypothetical protein C8Q77DRAFT_1048447 [Trametes polyzona]
MPPRNKRNVPSRRQRPPQPDFSHPEPQDLLSFDTEPEAQFPSVFELEAPPSDPELGRQSTLIRDNRHPHASLADPQDYAHDMYGPPTSGSDIDGDGPISISTSPPDPSPLRRYSIVHDAVPSPASARSGLSKLAVTEDTTSDDSSLSRSVGHTRSPVLARPRSQHPADREPTTLESFSRTIRNYVPSSIPIPTAAPSPPRVSRPVSFGSFLTPLTAPSSRDRGNSGDGGDTWKRRGSDTSAADPPWGTSRGDRDTPVFSLDDDIPEDGSRADERQTTRYPSVGDTEDVLWASWDTLADGDPSKPRSILILGYPTGVQLWDCSNLGSVAELLNLTGAQWGAVEYAGVLPDPPRSAADEFRQKRPLIAFSSRTVHGTDFLVYSLRSHEVVKRLSLIGFTSFAASTQFVILSTSNPPTIHVISSCTLATLYTIPSASLVAFAYPSPATTTIQHTTNANNVLPPVDIDTPGAAAPRPVYALSNRLLAYVTPLARPSTTAPPAPSASASGPGHTSTPVPVAADSQPKLALGMSQAELGTAAAKFGGTVLSGMRTLGGMAFSAARAGVSAAVVAASESPAVGSGNGGGGGFGSMFFSKSAPAATGSPHEYQTAQDRRRRSMRMSPPAFDAQSTASSSAIGPTSPVKHTHNTAPPAGCTITVIDLQPLLGPERADPEPVAQFAFTKPHALSTLRFSPDGTSLAVCAKDGHAVRVLQLRPAPRVARALSTSISAGPSTEPTVAAAAAVGVKDARARASEPAAHLEGSAEHVYTLRRGRTSAVVDGLEWAHDKLWFGMSTRKRTIHVFATNPLGGKPDGSSHIAGRVVNGQELVSSCTELSPLVRVRLRGIPHDASYVPCAFTFVRSSAATLPSSLLPPASVHFSTSSSPSSVQSQTGGALSKPVSPAQRPTRLTNYRDLLVFDPADGTLTLRRIVVERAAEHAGPVVPGSIPVAGGMSISLPGMSTLSRSMGASTSVSPPRAPSGLTQMMERAGELVGRESVVGTWALARGRDWPEVKQSVRSARVGGDRAGRVVRSDWLARAELSTFSTSPRILPRLIYLSHQFSFHLLGEDYHALIRSGKLAVPSSKIEVRRPVEVSAFATGSVHDDTFMMHGSPHDLSSSSVGAPPSSSFDAPLASALSAPLQPLHPSPPVLPMLPNGTPGSVSKGMSSLMHAIPIRHVADGMSGGLGRIRRELGKARSPRSGGEAQTQTQGSGPGQALDVTVPLEFDEEDEREDFLRHAVTDEDEDESNADVISRTTSMGTADQGAGTSVSASTPSTSLEPLPVEEEGEGGQAWQGWGPEDKQAVEDAERFDDITVGFLDEEQETMSMTMTMRAAAAAAEAEGKAGAKGKKRRPRRH